MHRYANCACQNVTCAQVYCTWLNKIIKSYKENHFLCPVTLIIFLKKKNRNALKFRLWYTSFKIIKNTPVQSSTH